MNGQIDELVWVEAADVTPVERARFDRDLTIHPRGYRGDKPAPIRLLSLAKDADGDEWYGLPIRYGLKFFQSSLATDSDTEVISGLQDLRSDGKQHRYASFPSPRDRAQGVFFGDLLRAARGLPAVLAEAPTGSGKTVAGLNLIARIGKSALVICPTSKIAQQWIESAVRSDILGLDRGDVGTIIGGKFDYVGKRITVAIIHNLTKRKKLPKGFRREFGIVIWDEAHNLAARTFSETMKHVSARHRIALTATPKRRDGSAKVFLHYFGAPCVVHTGDALAAKVRVFDYVWDPAFARKMTSKPPFVRDRMIAASTGRNAMLANIICRLYRAGRHLLVIGSRIGHLQRMIGLCADGGVPDKDLGLFTRSYINEKGKSIPLSNDELDFVAKNCRILFATYKMGAEGLDVPRLDSGVDIFPRAEGKQPIGRIRRPVQGKPMPLWITVRDVNIASLERMTINRLRDYRGCNVEVIEHGPFKNEHE